MVVELTHPGDAPECPSGDKTISNSVFLVRDMPRGWGWIGVVAHDT